MNKYIGIGVFVAAALLLTPIIFYIVYFGDNAISKNPNDWGPFGDFFGGIINPLIAFLTLIVTIYIAVELSRIEGKRNEKVLDFEKRRFLNELRETEYRRISSELQRLTSILLDKNPRDGVFQILMQLQYFREFNKHLFPLVDDKVFEDTVSAFSSLFEQLEKDTLENTKSDNKELVKKCIDGTFKCTKQMQTFIINQLESGKNA